MEKDGFSSKILTFLSSWVTLVANIIVGRDKAKKIIKKIAAQICNYENLHSYGKHSARRWFYGWEIHEVYVQSVLKMIFIFPLVWIYHQLLFIIAPLACCWELLFWPFSKEADCRLLRTAGLFLRWCRSETCWPACELLLKSVFFLSLATATSLTLLHFTPSPTLNRPSN